MSNQDRNRASSYLTNNTIRTYYALDESMAKAHFDDQNEEAEATAYAGEARPPLLIRARACMVLDSGDAPDFLETAREGIRIAKLGLSRCGDEAGELEKNLVEDCKDVLKAAEEAAAEIEDEDDDNLETVWEARMDDVEDRTKQDKEREMKNSRDKGTAGQEPPR